ncbi:MAG: hypothetical protein IIU64_02535 [Alistipes sp.]|nr:hypothetical protein [Alistipes sp.]
MRFFDILIDTIRRNPLTTVLFVMLLIAAPGILGIFALFLCIPLLFVVIGALVIRYRIRKVQQSMDEQLKNHGRKRSGTSYSSKGDGKVTVHIPHQEQKVSDDVGEYVSFKEVDDKE